MANKKRTFEEDLQHLQNIVEDMESGLDIESAMKLYEEGSKISIQLESRLSEIERKVYQVKNLDKADTNKETKLDLSLFE